MLIAANVENFDPIPSDSTNPTITEEGFRAVRYGPMFPRHLIGHFNILNGVSQLELNSTLFF